MVVCILSDDFRNCIRIIQGIIVDNLDGGLVFYIKDRKVAEWKQCRFNYREDGGAINSKDRVYVEVITDIWTIFDEEEE